MFGNRNDFSFNFLFGNNNFMSPNQTIYRSNMSDPKLKNTPSKTDTDKISPDDNTNLTDNNEIGLSPNGINNKNKTSGNSPSLNNDKTTIGKDARSSNQQNDSTINSFADGLNSLADTGSNSPVKPDNNVSDKSGISQRTKELVSLQSELAKKVTGSEVNDKKEESLLSSNGSKPVPVKQNTATSKNDYQGFYKQEESLLSSDGSKPMPVKPNTATPRDDNHGFYKQTESGEIKRLYPDTATPKGGSKIFFQENEGSEVTQSESGKVIQKYSDTATAIMKNGNQVIHQKSEDFEPVQPEAGKIEQNTGITITKNSNNAGANIRQIKSMGNGKIKGNQPSTNDTIKVPYDDKLKQQLGLGDRDELIEKQAQTYYDDIIKKLRKFKDPTPIITALEAALRKKNENTYVPASKIIAGEFQQVSLNVTNSNTNSFLLIDNHPEKLINGGKGLVSKYDLSDGKYTLASYHVNKSEGNGKEAERKLMYNFTAKEPVTVTLDNMSFSMHTDEATSGALKKHKISPEDLGRNISLNGKKLTEDELKKLGQKITFDKDGNVLINLDKGDKLSIETPSIEKDKNFTSDIGVNIKSSNSSKDNPINLEIRSVDRNGKDDPDCKLSEEKKEVWKNGQYDKNNSYTNTYTQDEINAKKTYYKNEIANCETIIKNSNSTSSQIAEAAIKMKELQLKEEEINKQHEGDNKQVGDIFKDPDFKLTGNIDLTTKYQITNNTIKKLIKQELKININESTLTNIVNNKANLDKAFKNANITNKELQEKIKKYIDLQELVGKDCLESELQQKLETIGIKDAKTQTSILQYMKLKDLKDRHYTKENLIDELKKLGITDNIQDIQNSSLHGSYNYIRIDPLNTEAYYMNEKNEKIKNKGAFFENLHYELTITNPTTAIGKEYDVVLIPGGGNIALYDKNGKLNIAKACNMESGAIIVPATTKNGIISFDYNVSGGSSLPVYAVIVER